jgi:uncharacterized protein (DUF1810 family)
MQIMNNTLGTSDPYNLNRYNLNRFLQAQVANYDQALAELRNGRKRSHWIWFIFPQIEGLGSSSMAQYYAIQSLDEAEAYFHHPVLGARLQECAEALLSVEGRSAREILGSPDDLKVRSCATLFERVSPVGSVFQHLLEKYYGGARDEKTLQRLEIDPHA